VPEGDLISYESMQALQLSPVTLPLTDVLTGLQTGLIEIVTMSPAGALILQWHTKVRYLTRMPIVYSMGLLAVQSRAFERLARDDQAIVREIMSELYAKWNSENSQDADEALRALINSGIQPVEPAAGAQERLQALMYENNRAMARSGLFSLELLEEILGYVEDYRSRQGTGNAVAAQ
jgi:TRAP-type C4-dicarboxylate transport system substrate-binding protein